MDTYLFEPIDRKATACNVRNFFDHQLDHYLALSGKHRGDLKSPVSDGQPSGSPIGNSTENRMMNIWLAEQIIDCVGKAMRNCTERSRLLLLGKYAENRTSYQTAELLNSSASTFTREQEDALNEFADRFEYQLVHHAIDEDVKDLHIFSKMG